MTNRLLYINLKSLFIIAIYIFLNLFIYFERVRVSEQGRGRESQRGSQARSILPAWSPTWGSNSRTVSSWPEPKSRVKRLTDWATRAPLCQAIFFKRLTFAYYFLVEKLEWDTKHEPIRRNPETGMTRDPQDSGGLCGEKWSSCVISPLADNALSPQSRVSSTHPWPVRGKSP